MPGLESVASPDNSKPVPPDPMDRLLSLVETHLSESRDIQREVAAAVDKQAAAVSQLAGSVASLEKAVDKVSPSRLLVGAIVVLAIGILGMAGVQVGWSWGDLAVSTTSAAP